MFQFFASSFLVIPILIIVELWTFLPEARLIYDFVSTQLIAECLWLVIMVEASVREMDVAISSRSISLPPWYMLSTVSQKHFVRERKNVTYAWMMFGLVFRVDVPVLNFGGLSSITLT